MSDKKIVHVEIEDQSDVWHRQFSDQQHATVTYDDGTQSYGVGNNESEAIDHANRSA
jgi:hypothetical protein